MSEARKSGKSFRPSKKGRGSWTRSVSFPDDTLKLIERWRDLEFDATGKRPNFSYSISYLIGERFILRRRMVNIQMELDKASLENRLLKKELVENDE